MSLSFDDIVRGAGQRRWTGDVATLNQFRAANGVLSRRQVKTLVERATQLIDGGKSHAAADLLFAGLILDGDPVLAEVQQAGVFRLSRRRYIGGATSVAARAVCEAIEPLGHVATEYLQSVVNLHRVARSVREEYKAIADWLSREREAGVKGALATLDWVFLTRTYAPSGAEAGWGLPDSPEYAAEHLAEGFSTILAIYAEQFGRMRDNAIIDAGAAARGDYVPRLMSAARLAEFRDWELLVDRMGHVVVQRPGDSEFVVAASSFEFHRAIEMGLAHSSMQRMNKPFEAVDPKARSFQEMGRTFTADGRGEYLVKLAEKPVPRYRFEIPEEVLSTLKNVGEFSREEQFGLAGACYDFVATTEEVMGFELGNGVKMRDLFLVSRVMQVMRCIWAEELLRHATTDFETVLQSMVPTFPRADLLKSVGFAVEHDIAAAIVELMQVDLSGHVDIQYRPLVPAGPNGELVMMPLNVFASSNLYRNPLVVSRRRLHEDGRFDPLAEGLRRMFDERGFACRKGVRFTCGENTGECDVMVVADDVVLVLECKHSLLPTSSHEMLTSVDYVRTAADQLGRFSRCFADAEFCKRLAKQTGLAFSANPVLVTGIIMSNRMLIGWRQDGHAVRGMYELQKFVKEGKVEMGEESKSMWIGPELCGEDLRRFFQDDLTYLPQWKCMDPFVLRYEFPGCTVETPKMALNMLKLARELGFAKAEAEMTKRLAERGIVVDLDGPSTPRWV